MTALAEFATATATFNDGETLQVSIDVNLGEQADVRVTRSGVVVVNTAVTTSRSIGPFKSGDTLSLYAKRGSIDYTIVGDTAITASRDLTAIDDGDRYYATTAITLTIPAGLSPRPELTVLPPPTGNLTIAFSGGATGNGAATSITRTRASNPAGIVITPYPDVTDGYGVSGA